MNVSNRLLALLLCASLAPLGTLAIAANDDTDSAPGGGIYEREDRDSDHDRDQDKSQGERGRRRRPHATVSPSPTPAPTMTPAPTTTPAPSMTPKPSMTPSPSATPAPTPAPTPTPTPKPSPTPTPTPALDGAALYNTYCSGCHGTSKRGSTATQIQTAINSNTGGMGFLSILTPAQITAISQY